MSKTLKSLILTAMVLALFTACGNSNKKTETAASSSPSVGISERANEPRPTGLAKWQVNAASLSSARWASISDNYPAADLEINPGESFNENLKKLLNNQYNLNEYICTKHDAQVIGKLNYQLITCVIPTYAEYSYFINLLDTTTKVNHIYEIKDIGVNKYLGKERDSDPERVYEYDISAIESLPFMDTNAILLQIDRKYTISASIEDGADVKTDYDTYENYIFAGKDLRLVTHWSAKHAQTVKDWMSCDRSNPDPKLCPNTTTQQVCSQIAFDGTAWHSGKADCL